MHYKRNFNVLKMMIIIIVYYTYEHFDTLIFANTVGKQQMCSFDTWP